MWTLGLWERKMAMPSEWRGSTDALCHLSSIMCAGGSSAACAVEVYTRPFCITALCHGLFSTSLEFILLLIRYLSSTAGFYFYKAQWGVDGPDGAFEQSAAEVGSPRSTCSSVPSLSNSSPSVLPFKSCSGTIECVWCPRNVHEMIKRYRWLNINIKVTHVTSRTWPTVALLGHAVVYDQTEWK